MFIDSQYDKLARSIILDTFSVVKSTSEEDVDVIATSKPVLFSSIQLYQLEMDGSDFYVFTTSANVFREVLRSLIIKLEEFVYKESNPVNKEELDFCSTLLGFKNTYFCEFYDNKLGITS